MEDGGSLSDWVVGSVPGEGGVWWKLVGVGREQERQLEEAERVRWGQGS